MVLASHNECYQCSVIAAYCLHSAIESKPLTNLDFYHWITLCLLTFPIKSRLQIGGARIAVLPENVRNDSADHIRESASKGR